MAKSFKKRFIGDKKFYKTVLAVALPIMIQNAIANLVALVDNVMVGSLSTEAMSGVSIVNQFTFIFNLLVFGIVSAGGIFTAQYFGKRDFEGVKNTFRLKVIMNLIAGILGVVCFILFKNQLINLFLHEGEGGDLALTLEYGIDYLMVLVIGFIPFAMYQSYASTMRETGDTLTPMIASITAVITNCVLNAVFIFGLIGMPAMGVKGAALATVISRFIELFILIFKTSLNKEKYPFMKGAFKNIKIPKSLVKQIIVKGLPLAANELLWAIATILRNQCYSTRGLEVVAAQNISTTLFNVFAVTYLALGQASAILVGAKLGANKIQEAIEDADKLKLFSVVVTTGIALVFSALAFVFPLAYNTSDSIRLLARNMMLSLGVTMPFIAYAHAIYFVMRSGGKVLITFLFDSVFMWVVVIPICFILSRFTAIPIMHLFIICQATEVIKCVFGWVLYRRKTWAKSLVND